MTPEQLKGRVRKISNEKKLKAQHVLQMYFFERFLVRLGDSKFSSNFILKGGFLISSIIGMESRTTMDLDATIKGLSMDEETIKAIMDELCKIHTNDGLVYVFDFISSIRDDDAYENFRVHLIVNYGKIKAPLKIDLTTGDEITPTEIDYLYRMMFDDDVIHLKSYTIETILAEKYETILSRNISTTRMRDFYDIYALMKLEGMHIEYDVLRVAILKTSMKRNSITSIENWKAILEDIKADETLHKLWVNYLLENEYITVVPFIEIIQVVERIARLVNA